MYKVNGMLFDKIGFFDSKSNVSPGSIGGKIKRFRELRGWTQKELGLRAGFSESTADVRIAQYEKNKRVPKENVLKDIAYALEIDETALFDADLLNRYRMYHALFDIEDFHGLQPVKIGRSYYLVFSEYDTLTQKDVMKPEFQDFLEKWYEIKQKYLPNEEDSDEEKERKAKEYTLWRGGYPHNEAVENSEQLSYLRRIQRLQDEMDDLNAKMKNDEELYRLDESLKGIMDEVRSSCKPIKMESDFILRIKELVEQGVNINIYSPEALYEPNYEVMHLLSVRTEEILFDEHKKRLYAQLVCGIDDIQQFGIDISRKITSKDKVLFVTYSYRTEQYMYFQNLNKFWDDLIFIAERKNVWPDFRLQEYEERFLVNITGKNDVPFSKRLDES